MAPKLAGHALQLAGHALTFLGLAVVVAALALSGGRPGVPFWWFVVGSGAVAVPLMIAGGRVNARGRGLVLDQSPEQARAEYRLGVIVLALYLGFLWAHGLVVVAPMLLQLTGPVHPSDTFVRVWLAASMLFLCATRPWVSRPLWRRVEAWAVGRWGHPTNAPSPSSAGKSRTSRGLASNRIR